MKINYSISIEIPLVINLRKQLCKTCFAKKGKVYDCIIQLRTDENVDELYRKIKKLLDTMFPYEIREKIVDVVKLDEGIDIYLIGHNVGRKIVKKLEKMFSISEKKESHKIYGVDERGKKKSRLTILLRLS